MLLLLIELYFHSPDWSTSNILIFLCHKWKCLPASLTKTSFFYGPHIQVEEVLWTIEHIFSYVQKALELILWICFTNSCWRLGRLKVNVENTPTGKPKTNNNNNNNNILSLSLTEVIIIATHKNPLDSIITASKSWHRRNRGILIHQTCHHSLRKRHKEPQLMTYDAFPLI